MKVRAYIGLGSNLAGVLDSSQAHIHSALKELAQLPESHFVASSGLYRSKPLVTGNAIIDNQSDYINAVAAIDTCLAPEALLDALQAIETHHDRVRNAKWGPRTLDLDILLYGTDSIKTPRLCVPHPGLAERSFVLYPLADIAPELVIPGAGGLSHLLQQWSASDLPVKL